MEYNCGGNLVCRTVLVAGVSRCPILIVLGVGHWVLSWGRTGWHDWFQCSWANLHHSSKPLKPGQCQPKTVPQPCELPPFQDLVLDPVSFFLLFSLFIKKRKNQTSPLFTPLFQSHLIPAFWPQFSRHLPRLEDKELLFGGSPTPCIQVLLSLPSRRLAPHSWA